MAKLILLMLFASCFTFLTSAGKFEFSFLTLWGSLLTCKYLKKTVT